MAQATDLARVQRVAMAAITGQWHPSHTGGAVPRAAGHARDSSLPAVRGADSYKVQTQGHLLTHGRGED